ncbi:hypothetical protein COEREDRAFT_85043 [Coemansia reversa NRRL 1564]|uniref:AAA-ATPase-like domain-containing protein n=1 Tax=Coemansia reversa (strain ATCC 12441 / NRRL 1564) TaxID=763665 RepID=A0A2G5BHR2_COERN|nr:hypothetical protein COEREDRAFT_85043 [Coemansia reversa NRRL 1564]|eukprot:PIA18564.1 hypothetical protein COEREDRAFT_85043 [Coemansia reversa NRRL 1564]
MTLKRKRSQYDLDVLTQFDWSPSGDVSIWSLSSLTTDSTNLSIHKLSPNNNSYDSNEDTLAASYADGLTSLISSSSLSYKQPSAGVDIETPCNRVTKRRREPYDDTDENMRAAKVFAKQPNLVIKKSSPRTKCGKSVHITPTKPSRKIDEQTDSNNHTPEKLSQSLRPSGSPTRVSGSKVVADINFADIDGSGVCKVDKSLVCKGFWEAIGKAGRICLPRRSGKTYNLTQLLLFFSSSPELEYLTSIPDSVIRNDITESNNTPQLDIATKCRLKRECLFKDSLLNTMYPEFVEEHFMKYPVLHISMSDCKGETLGDFVIKLCSAIEEIAQRWIDDMEIRKDIVNPLAKLPLERLRRRLRVFDDISCLQASEIIEYTGIVQALFKQLSTFISKQYGRYILLIDEYDIPFITVHLASWSKKEKQSAQNILKQLFQTMLKDNKNLIKGLLFGVFEIPLTEMGSGANNIKDIRMIPAEKNDIQGSILSASHPHSGSGMDALTDSFWFNASEVELMLDSSTKWCSQIATHKAFIMQTIREWYNGYFIGRFRGKYNPWSVSSFIESLCNLLNQSGAEPVDIEGIVKAAARPYWVTTGTTGLIEAQIDRHRPQFIRLAKQLLCNYEAVKHNDTNEELCCNISHIPLVSTRVNLIAFDNDQFSEPGLLTLCLYAGYLTRWVSTSVCIPNHEVYEVWLHLFARAVLGTEMADNSTNYERGALLKELWSGKADLLCSLATSSHGVLSNHNGYEEKDYANHVANTLMAVSRFGMLTHPQQNTVRMSHVVPIRENHAGTGRCDYVMRLYSSKNVANQFGVVIEFKLIENNKRDDREYHRKLAEKSLKQIANNNYDACLVGCLERMDVGMAIGNSVVHAVTRLYRRQTDDSPWKEVSSLIKRRHCE